MKVGENMRIPEPVLNEDFYMVKRIGGDVALPAPRTRFEELLYIYAGGTIERPTPKTVEERFLDYITGGESELPAPKTRLQSYMYNVANPSNKIPIVPPKTRFECYWFVVATANAIISTDNPVEFTSLDGFLLDYTICGNTEQDLSEIEIRNMFTNGYSLDRETGLPINITGRVATINPVCLMQGEYNVKYSVNVDWNIGVVYTIIDGGTLVQRTVVPLTTSFNISLSDNYSVYFCVYPESGYTDKIVTADIINSFKITAIDGQICPSPDYQIDVKGVGDYSTNIMGDILYGVALNYQDGTTVFLDANDMCSTDFFTVELNEAKSLSISGVPLEYNVCFFIYSTDNSFIGRTSSQPSGNLKINYNSVVYKPITPANTQLTTGAYHVKIAFSFASGTTNFDGLKTAPLMLNNSTNTYVEYQPKDKYIIPLSTVGQGASHYSTNNIVLDEPLFEITGHVDSVNYLTQKELRNVKKLVIDGTSVKFFNAINTGTARFGVGLYVPDAIDYSGFFYSNIAKNRGGNQNDVEYRNLFTLIKSSDTVLYLLFPKTYINIPEPTINQIVNFFNNKAQELYNNGKPIIYYFPITSKEVPAEIPKIQTYTPKTELTVGTEVDPSQIEVVTRTE